jgi:hypothetical protein
MFRSRIQALGFAAFFIRNPNPSGSVVTGNFIGAITSSGPGTTAGGGGVSSTQRIAGH